MSLVLSPGQASTTSKMSLDLNDIQSVRSQAMSIEELVDAPSEVSTIYYELVK